LLNTIAQYNNNSFSVVLYPVSALFKILETKTSGLSLPIVP